MRYVIAQIIAYTVTILVFPYLMVVGLIEELSRKD